jgi:hypothetical protein
MPKQPSPTEIAEFIRRMASNTIFSCRFIKRTTGEERLMVCRLGVAPKTSNDSNSRDYNPINKGLLTVWDVQKKAYRTISLDSIISIKIAGTDYVNESAGLPAQ